MACCHQCQGIEDLFGEKTAEREIRRYRRRGPGRSTRLLLDALEAEGVAGRTFLDVGGGVGVIQHELLAQGAAAGTHADASPAYLEAARREAHRLGHADRMRYLAGDVVELAREGALDDADLVTLDRVVCCYPDMEALVDATAGLARRAYALVIPRETLLNRIGTRLVNAFQTLRRHPFRVFLHDTGAVEARVGAHGLRKRFHARTLLWQTLVFFR